MDGGAGPFQNDDIRRLLVFVYTADLDGSCHLTS